MLQVGVTEAVFQPSAPCAKLCCKGSWCTIGTKREIPWAKCDVGHHYKWCQSCTKAITARNWSTVTSHKPTCTTAQPSPGRSASGQRAKQSRLPATPILLTKNVVYQLRCARLSQ